MADPDTQDKHDRIYNIKIETEMQESYMQYAMSVITLRAIPDVFDGLKPVHRRVMYAMFENNYTYDKPHRKSARIVGDVISKYHPHGDVPIYESLVRMGQDFSMNIKLIDGQGNFGSIDGDPAAAMRYTEARMSKIANDLIADIDKNTVNFRANYDNTTSEPIVLPARFPNILVNGTSGVAVGMATNIPPYNIIEVLDGCMSYLNLLLDNGDDNNIAHHASIIEQFSENITQIIKGPDFPTSGILIYSKEVKTSTHTGRGSIVLRGKTHVENLAGNRQSVVITEIPYQVNKAKMIEKIAELVKDKKLNGISDLRDESDRTGIRVVIDLKRDTNADLIINQLLSMTSLQISFGINTLVLHNGMPKLMSVPQIISAFLEFRIETVRKRTLFLLNKVQEKLHTLIGLYVAINNIDKIIAIIRAAQDTNDARQQLIANRWQAGEVIAVIKLMANNNIDIEDSYYTLTDIQARAILDMRLQKLTGLEKGKIFDEINSLYETMKEYANILSSDRRIVDIIKIELEEIRANFGIPRRTEIAYDLNVHNNDEDLMEQEDVIVTITATGYIKRVHVDTYRTQHRGGRGKIGQNMKDNDEIIQIFSTNTHENILFFSNLGRVYRIKVYELPTGDAHTRGRPIVNFLPGLSSNEKVTQIMTIPRENAPEYICFLTQNGRIRRNALSDFSYIPSNGKIAIKFSEENEGEMDSIVGVLLCNANDTLMIATRSGKAICFKIEALRVFKSRSSDGVRGINLKINDQAISLSMVCPRCDDGDIVSQYTKIPYSKRLEIKKSHQLQCLDDNIVRDEAIEDEAEDDNNTNLDLNIIHQNSDKILQLAVDEEFILSVTSKGFGKRSSAYLYRITNRGGSGIINMLTSKKNGHIVSNVIVNNNDDVIIMTNKAKIIRIQADAIRVSGRNTQGVKLINLQKDEEVVSVAIIATEE